MRNPLRRSNLSVAILSIAGLMAACSSPTATSPAASLAQNQQRLVIAVQPTNTPEQLTSDAQELRAYLEQRLGRPVELVFPTTFAGVIEAMRFGHAQAAFMSAWPAALAQRHAGAEVVLAEVREVVIGDQKAEAPYYYSYWVVRPDSEFTSLDQLRGRKAAMPSQLSTSGYVAPMAKLVDLGLVPGDKEADPKAFFSDVIYSGGYAQGWEALKNGQVDATVIAGDVAESLYRDVLANTRVIETQGPIPSHGVVFSKDLVDPTRTLLRDALMDLGRPEYRPMMRKFISGIFVGFTPTTTQEHLASLNGYLERTQLAFVERLR
ncbi:MAG: Phosphate/phosphite/phosphonate transporter substrate-binding protein [Chloroflexi bacterium]|nr:Phosphate/phosphite/phosphonate transporter substrate-binding protein [Chloroflexota bacterium]